MSEGEFLDITEIKRQQAEDYECITHNGVAPPDQQKVRVTVNCKYYSVCRTQKPSGRNPAQPHVHNYVLIVYVNVVNALVSTHFNFILCGHFSTLYATPIRSDLIIQ